MPTLYLHLPTLHSITDEQDDAEGECKRVGKSDHKLSVEPEFNFKMRQFGQIVVLGIK